VPKRNGMWFFFCVSFSVFISLGRAQVFGSSEKSCQDQIRKSVGRIDYQESIKSGDLGFHHCVHRVLTSNDFPTELSVSDGKECQQMSMPPEATSIEPPLPHQSNEYLALYDRPNPFYLKEGTACAVVYTQYYFRP